MPPTPLAGTFGYEPDAHRSRSPGAAIEARSNVGPLRGRSLTRTRRDYNMSSHVGCPIPRRASWRQGATERRQDNASAETADDTLSGRRVAGGSAARTTSAFGARVWLVPSVGDVGA
ncbi:MAG: hypothetical protein QOD72_2518, partial [Acidimicrobiaceae bacterium]|nr:hypothetical protein [Acidimicrobiaceae bacterium]